MVNKVLRDYGNIFYCIYLASRVARWIPVEGLSAEFALDSSAWYILLVALSRASGR